MENVPFIRTVAAYGFKGLDVIFTVSDKKESLELALDFDKPGDTSIIGKGFSKIGIYVSI
jgi:hypothetical protein